MKETNKKIATGLAATTIGGGIAIAAIAQQCTTTIVQPEVISIVLRAVNNLQNYQNERPADGSLELGLLVAMETAIQQDLINLRINTLSFDPIDNNDVLIESNGNYRVPSFSVTGSAVETNDDGDAYFVTGATTEINVSTTQEETLRINNVIGLAARSSRRLIVNAVNELSAYNGADPQSALALEIFNTIDGTNDNNIRSLRFNQIDNTNVAINENVYTITIPTVTGWSTGVDTLVGTVTGSITLVVTNTVVGSPEQLVVETSTGLSISLIAQETLNQINLLHNFQPGRPANPTGLTLEILDILDFIIKDHADNASLVGLNFNPRSLHGFSINGSNNTVIISIPFTTFATSPSIFGVRGPMLLAFSIDAENGSFSISRDNWFSVSP